MKNNDYVSKNDFIFFQNEILGDIKKFQTKINERVNGVTSLLETQKFLDDKKTEELKSMIQNITKEKNGPVNLEPFENKLKESINNMQSLSSKLEVKFNLLNRDFNNACFRYDKAISSNLIIPGVIGTGCPYENLRAFLEFANKKLLELNRDKEKSTLDTKLYKEKLEGLIKTNQTQLETMEFKMKDVFRKQLASNDNLLRDRITEVYNKIETDKNNNEKIIDKHEKIMNDQEKLINEHELVINKHKLNLDIIAKNFDKFYEEDWEKLNKLVKELNNNIEKNNEQILALNNKTKEIEDLIKKMQENDLHNRNNCRNTLHKENSQSSEIKNSKFNSLNNSKTIQKNEKDENKKSDENSKKNSISSKKEISKDKTIQITPEKEPKKSIINLKQNIIEKEVINKSEAEQTSMIQDYKDNSKKEIIEKAQLQDKMNNEYNNNENLSKSRNIIKSKKKDLKRLYFRQMSNEIMKVKNNIENNKAHDSVIFISNNKMNETYFNKSYFFKVVNYNNVFKDKNQTIKTKSEKSPKIKKNEGMNTLELKRNNKNNLSESYNIQFKNLNLGPEFYENEIRFIDYSKHNLSQAYLMARARLEEQQKLKLNIISTFSSNGNLSVKSLSQNKFKFNRNYNEFRKNKQKEIEKSTNKSLSINDNQFMLNTNFPFFNKALPKDLSNNINEKKKMYSSCINYNKIEKKKEFNKDSNRTYIDYNILNEPEIKKVHYKKNRIENINDKKMSSSNLVFQQKGKNFTPNIHDSSFHNFGKFVENSKELSLDQESV